jgi:nucleotide-binding universal stress UspA family protein
MYKKIMVPLDGSDLAECVLPHAIEMAQQNKAELILVRVVEPIANTNVEGGIFVHVEQIQAIEDGEKLNATKYLEKIKTRLSNEKISSKSHVLFGNAAAALIEFVEKNDIDAVVIATHGRSGVGRWVWGSTAERLLHHICVPVLMVRAPGCFPNIK